MKEEDEIKRIEEALEIARSDPKELDFGNLWYAVGVMEYPTQLYLKVLKKIKDQEQNTMSDTTVRGGDE